MPPETSVRVSTSFPVSPGSTEETIESLSSGPGPRGVTRSPIPRVSDGDVTRPFPGLGEGPWASERAAANGINRSVGEVHIPLVSLSVYKTGSVPGVVPSSVRVLNWERSSSSVPTLTWYPGLRVSGVRSLGWNDLRQCTLMSLGLVDKWTL